MAPQGPLNRSPKWSQGQAGVHDPPQLTPPWTPGLSSLRAEVSRTEGETVGPQPRCPPCPPHPTNGPCLHVRGVSWAPTSTLHPQDLSSPVQRRSGLSPRPPGAFTSAMSWRPLPPPPGPAASVSSPAAPVSDPTGAGLSFCSSHLCWQDLGGR